MLYFPMCASEKGFKLLSMPFGRPHMISYQPFYGNYVSILCRLRDIISYLWPPCVANADIIFFVMFLLSSFFPRLVSAAADWMSTILLHIVWS